MHYLEDLLLVGHNIMDLEGSLHKAHQHCPDQKLHTLECLPVPLQINLVEENFHTILGLYIEVGLNLMDHYSQFPQQLNNHYGFRIDFQLNFQHHLLHYKTHLVVLSQHMIHH